MDNSTNSTSCVEREDQLQVSGGHTDNTNTPHPLHTCTHPHHAPYSEANLPPILFRLDPPSQEQQMPITDLVEDGMVVKDANGTPLRNFTFLPRYISVRPPGWLLEYWMRTDSRLTYRDIKARMTTSDLPSDNVLNMRREREARSSLGLSCWATRRGTIARVEVERVERWTPDQIAHNTTMVVEYTDPTSDGAKRVPLRLRAKTLIPAQPVYFPLDTFLENGRPHIPSRRIARAIDLFYRLSETALERQLDTWQQLDPSELPWKSSKKSKENEPGEEPNAKVSRTRRWKCPSTSINGLRVSQAGEEIEVTEAPLSEEDNTINTAHESRREEASPDSDDEELRASGLPKIERRHGSREQADIDNQQKKGSRGHRNAPNNLRILMPWSTVNRHQRASQPPGVDQPASKASPVDKPQKAVLSSPFSDIRPRQTCRNGFPSLESINQQTSHQETAAEKRIKQDPEAPVPEPESTEPEPEPEPQWFNRYRFNGSGPYSILNNRRHALNTNTDEVMRRNNPFTPQNMQGDGMPSSVEQYLNESIRRFGGASYPSP
ncbi:hypothetical protein VTN00DRAFT_6223 [Thermoascus crustaceus]|uniref:uncharacterized protein n=1 Tax=Thermoascus crustaceus TaxID=5088 RepID=UPI003742E079